MNSQPQYRAMYQEDCLALKAHISGIDKNKQVLYNLKNSTKLTKKIMFGRNESPNERKLESPRKTPSQPAGATYEALKATRENITEIFHQAKRNIEARE